MNSPENKNKIIDLLDSIFLSIFILGVLSLMGFQYILNEKPHPLLFYVSITSFGLFLVTFLIKYYLAPLKKLDIDFFRNIIIGITGGIVVWILSTTNLSSFRTDFWLSSNNLLVKLGFAIFTILIGYIICKKK